MKTLLILGAGLVSPPLVRYFQRRDDVKLLIAAAEFSRIGASDRVRQVRFDANDEASLRALMSDADAVVSLLPAPLLPAVSRIAVEERRHLVSTSYATDAIRALDGEARAAGVLLLNEAGFDPGIDHMTAMKSIEEIKRNGGRVTKFTSAAAGLPSPEADTNPWHYKFSWSPRGAIRAAQADARFLRNGEIVDVAGRDLIDHLSTHHIDGLGAFEMYPNRDSLIYRDLYRLHDATDLFRGTLRYPGWIATIDAAAKLGWMSFESRRWPEGATFRKVSGSTDGLDREAIARLEWAGFFSDEKIARDEASPFDVFVDRLGKRLRYETGERDMAILHHVFEADFGDRQEIIRSGIVAYGDSKGDSAMSKLVGLTAAIAAALVIDDRIAARGVQIPVLSEIYEPVLGELAEHGVRIREG
jgi:saccharopine dehydrogenase (NADP+, L-glutamate forming)